MPYIPHTPSDIEAMLKAIGAKSVDELFCCIPEKARLKQPLKLPKAVSETEITRELTDMVRCNQGAHTMPSFLGAGCYNHFIPKVVDHLAGRSEFYTSYTPYQPEISQGMLQSFFEYQTMMCELTGLDVSNASLYDGATAVAEAALMSLAVTNKNKIVISKTVHPEYRQVLKTYLHDLSKAVNLVEIGFKDGVTDMAALKGAVDADTACVIFQTPNFFGAIEPADEISAIIHNVQGLLVSFVNPVSLALLKPPSAYGADIAIGDGQSLGNTMSFGGPHLGFMVVKKDFVRKMPGRIIGQTVDTDGQRGFVLTLSTREQHIRREKATSNICSNEGLLALRAAIHMSALGKQGLREAAEQCLQKAHYLASKLSAKPGYKLLFASPFFNEFVVQCPEPVFVINKKLLDKGIIGGLDLSGFYPELKHTMLMAVTEMNTKEEMDELVKSL
ncbi:MAG: aminomethyl-transferring glycine dehydrogenase subunit GcvPA [Candidatus Brocadiia bacterium]